MENGKKLIFLFSSVNLIVFSFSVKVSKLSFEHKLTVSNKYFLLSFLSIANHKSKLLQDTYMYVTVSLQYMYQAVLRVKIAGHC